ncbi:hypothetical protein CYMTET_33176 [Cymbomonas tetramitiformis]|uniref:Uncharacterized protein n=1 Tax=Cymbomonas tetramitiformis TaxID=36881 RepID=A0AAE0KRG7_9CHLO|nr:hypothetical protein CYMTET_33176 [Cymbomonas tetramitiformis]
MGKRGKGTKRKSSHGITLVAQGQGHIKRTLQSPFDPAGSDDTTYYVRESDKGRTFERCNPNSDSEEDELEDGPQQPDQFEELRVGTKHYVALLEILAKKRYYVNFYENFAWAQEVELTGEEEAEDQAEEEEVLTSL